MENLARAGVRNLWSRAAGTLNRVTNAPAKKEDKGTIVLSKPRSDTALENELMERERKSGAGMKGLKTKKTKLQQEQQEYADEQGLNDEEQLWMRINQNAQYTTEELITDPKVDSRMFNIEKLQGIKAPDFGSKGAESAR